MSCAFPQSRMCVGKEGETLCPGRAPCGPMCVKAGCGCRGSVAGVGAGCCGCVSSGVRPDLGVSPRKGDAQVPS